MGFTYLSSLCVQDIEYHLGEVIMMSMKANWDTRSKLRLLDVFHGITHRDLVQVSPPLITHCERFFYIKSPLVTIMLITSCVHYGV